MCFPKLVWDIDEQVEQFTPLTFFTWRRGIEITHQLYPRFLNAMNRENIENIPGAISGLNFSDKKTFFGFKPDIL